MTTYPEVLITKEQARRIAEELYGISGKVFALPGEIDFNFRIASKNKCYLLKVGRPDFDRFLLDYFDEFAFQSLTTEDFRSYLDTTLLRTHADILDADRQFIVRVGSNVHLLKKLAYEEVETLRQAPT